MRLYLSSFRMGDHSEHLAALVGGDGRNVVVIANALDDAPADVRRSGVEGERPRWLTWALMAPSSICVTTLARSSVCAVTWPGRASPGCVAAMSLCSATRSSAAAGTLCSVTCLRQTGWSTPDTAQDRVSCLRACGALRLSRCRAVTRIYGSEPVWDGLALLTEAFLPHYQSPGHPETAAMDLVVARYQAEGVSYRPLRDGQALLINGPDTKIV